MELPRRATLSVAIITLNEEANLDRTLASVAWADERVVVDAGSTDGTAEIAAVHGARFVSERWRGFAAQKNRALDLCSGDWILSLDADEVVTPELAASIQQVLARIRQLAAHEVGHTLGLAHNFAASTLTLDTSVMDYPHPAVELGADGRPDLSHAYAAGIGAWDKAAITYGYAQFAPGTPAPPAPAPPGMPIGEDEDGLW